MSKASWFWALAALLFGGVASQVVGCGDDDDTSTDGDADADSDVDADSDSDGDGDCTTGNPLANDGCDWTCNDAAQPDFKLAAIELSAPAALANMLVQGIVTTAIDNNDFVWLLENSGGNFRTGAGFCDEDSLFDCEFDDANEPAAGTLDYDQGSGDFAVPSGAAIEFDADDVPQSCTGSTLAVTVVIHSDAAGDIPLSLQDACLTGTVSHGGNCVGQRANETLPSMWVTDDGAVAGKITMTDAMAVNVTDPINTTLCDLLAGSQPDGFCAANPDPDQWDPPPDTVPPDTSVGEEPAWTLSATFAAIGANIAP